MWREGARPTPPRLLLLLHPVRVGGGRPLSRAGGGFSGGGGGGVVRRPVGCAGGGGGGRGDLQSGAGRVSARPCGRKTAAAGGPSAVARPTGGQSGGETVPVDRGRRAGEGAGVDFGVWRAAAV